METRVKFTIKSGTVDGSRSFSGTDPGGYTCELPPAPSPYPPLQKSAEKDPWWLTRWGTNLGASGLLLGLLGGVYLFFFVIAPFALDVAAGEYPERWYVSSEYSETWNALDEDGKRVFLRMGDSKRAEVAKLPLDERVSKIEWLKPTKKPFCPYGEPGYNRCQSKAEHELGMQMLEFFLDRK